MIAEVIWLKFEVRYKLNYVSNFLKKLGYSNQKARFISDQQEEEHCQVARKKRLEEKPCLSLLKKPKQKTVWFVWR